MYRSTRNATDADDIVQEAFCRLLRSDSDALSDEESRRYLFRIAGNLMTDRWRRGSRELSWLERLRGETSVEAGPVEVYEGVPEFDALNRRDRALLWLAYVEEQSHVEIAHALGLARGSVKVLLSRARARLRALVSKRTTTRPS